MKLFGLKIERLGNNSVSKDVYKASLDVKNSLIKMLEASNQRYIDMNNDLLSQLKTQNKGTIEERMLDTAIKLFSPTNKTPVQTTLQTPIPKEAPTPLLESGVEYTDPQIREIISGIPTTTQTYLANLPESSFAERVKQKIPDISETSILKAHQILKEGI